MNRAEVFAAIDTEREYQIRRWGFRDENRMIEAPHSLEEFLLYMEDYMHEARHQLSRLPEPEAREIALHTLRKVVTLGIAAHEQLGCPHRDLSVGVINGRDGLPA